VNERVREFLDRASKEPVHLTVRELLGLWGFTSRNSFETVGQIEGELSAAGVRCEPSFTTGGLGDLVQVGPQSYEPTAPDATEATDDDAVTDEPLRLPPVAPLIESIPSATGQVIFVSPDQTLEQAQGLMIKHDYSQLPVMTSERDLKGVVSWRSIARARVFRSTITLRNATDEHPPVVYVTDKLLDAVGTIYDADFVFVRDRNDRICGIVTTADLSGQFRELSAPFFQIGEVEGLLRSRIGQVFPIEEIRVAVKSAKLGSVDDMTFFQYQLLLDHPDRWSRMHWLVDRGMFIDCLDKTRHVRNKIMHFDQGNLTPDDRNQIVQCLNYVRAMVPTA
jgi:CBS domain-containing protein